MQNEGSRIVCLSDTHNNVPKVPNGDIVLHAGDATGRGSIQEVTKFIWWFSQLPHDHKVFVAGNHDFLFEEEPSLARRMMQDAGIIYLQDESVTIRGFKIYGSPWQPEFCNWAFNLERGEQLAEKWAMIPEDTDILITHSPPYGILDKVEELGWIKTQNEYDDYMRMSRAESIDKVEKPVGCEELLKRVKIVKPRLHIFGHIHEGYGMEIIDETIYKNVSICNGRYQPLNIPQMVIVAGEQFSVQSK